MPRTSRLILTVIALSLVLATCGWARGDLTVCVMDVGQGLCIVTRTPAGRIMVIDCGTSGRENNRKVASVPIRYLSGLGADHIDLAVLTHPHDDHVSGYADLLRAKPARIVLDLGQPHSTAGYRWFLGQVRRCRAKYIIARRGQSFWLEKGVVATVISPPPAVGWDLNDRSIVLRLTYKNVAFLFAADAGAEAERAMLNSGRRVRAQVLQVGHHGSASASTVGWLAAIKPSAAIVSCGRRNDYGHPAQEVLRRLRSLKAKVYRTDEDGAVLCRTDGHRVWVRPFRRHKSAGKLRPRRR